MSSTYCYTPHAYDTLVFFGRSPFFIDSFEKWQFTTEIVNKFSIKLISIEIKYHVLFTFNQLPILSSQKNANAKTLPDRCPVRKFLTQSLNNGDFSLIFRSKLTWVTHFKEVQLKIKRTFFTGSLFFISHPSSYFIFVSTLIDLLMHLVSHTVAKIVILSKNSRFENVNFNKTHNLKISVLTIWKSQIPRNFRIKNWIFVPVCVSIKLNHFFSLSWEETIYLHISTVIKRKLILFGV